MMSRESCMEGFLQDLDYNEIVLLDGEELPPEDKEKIVRRLKDMTVGFQPISDWPRLTDATGNVSVHGY